EMEKVNTHGIVAARNLPEPIKNAWWENQTIREIVNPPDTDRLRAIEQLFVFTPTGEVAYALRQSYTLIDFAFIVNPSMAPYARHFWVNGRQVNYERELRSRDLVEIEYNTPYPTLKPEWEEAARSS